MSSADDPMTRPHRATDGSGGHFSFAVLRASALIAVLFCLALLAGAAPAVAGTPGSQLARLGPALWVFAACLLGAIASCRTRIDEWFVAHRTAGFMVTAVVCAFAAWLALSPNLNARFGVIDDHVIVSEIGPGRSRLQWRQWGERFRNSEALSFGADGRYRPGYAALQLAECCWWGRDVKQWYLARIALCGATLFFLLRAASHGAGFTLAFSGVVALLGTPAVADTFCRLGPAEAYGIAALALGIWALAKASRAGSAWLWWMAAAAFALASMFKENFVPLAGMACVIGALVLRQPRNRARASPWIPLTLLAMHTAAMLVVIARMLLAKGHDIYSEQVGAGSFAGPVASGVMTLLFNSALAALWPLLGWTLWSWRQPPADGPPATAPPRSLLSKDALLFLVTALAAWFSQAAFYRDNDWPPGSRYDLPGILVPIALLVFGTRHLMSLARCETANRIVLPALFTGLMFAGAYGTVVHVRSAAASNVAVTRHFASWVDRIAKTALAEPSLVLVLVPERPLDHYEPAVSVARFLRFKKVTNPITYTSRFLEQPVGNPKEAALFGEMKRGISAREPVLLDTPAAGALFVPFGAGSAAKLAAEQARLSPTPLDEALRKSRR